jgi:predicted ester cyclase
MRAPTPNADRADRSLEDMIRLVEEAFNAREDWRIEELVADHLIEHPAYLGGVDFRVRAEMIRAVMPDATMHLEEALTRGDVVTSRWTITGTHRGKMLGFGPTGRRITLSGVSVYRFEEGRVAEHWEFPDLARFVDQFPNQAEARAG